MVGQSCRSALKLGAARQHRHSDDASGREEACFILLVLVLELIYPDVTQLDDRLGFDAMGGVTLVYHVSLGHLID